MPTESFSDSGLFNSQSIRNFNLSGMVQTMLGRMENLLSLVGGGFTVVVASLLFERVKNQGKS